MSEINYSTGALMEAVNNKVDLDGVQTISGKKTFEKETVFKFVEGEGNGQARFISMDDRYGLIFRVDDGGNFYFLSTNENDANGSWNDLRPFQINLADGNVYVPTPLADSNGKSVATTAFVKTVLKTSGKGLATISKSGNGYCSFTNGLKVQWGQNSTPDTVTYPTAFTATPRVALAQVSSSNDQRNIVIYDVTKTNFKSLRYSSEVASFQWLAIGY